MTTRKYSSRSQQTTLTASISSTATSVTVVSASALMGGVTVPAGQTYTIVIDPDTAIEEIVDVSNWSSGNTLTVTRGVDGSSPQEHSAGAVVRHMMIGRDLREANTHIENTTSAHGLTLADVLKVTDTGRITSSQIADGTIVDADINASAAIAKTKIAGVAITTADTGTVTSAIIADGTIVDGDINAAAAIAKTKISGTAITAADAGTVTSTMIADGTIVNTDIASAANIDKTKIAGTAVTLSDTGTITGTMIADGTITNTDISPTAGIAYSKLSLTGSIVSSDIADGTIVDADISPSAAISNSKLATNPLARANHTGTQVAATISDFDTQVRTSRLDQMSAPTADVSMNTRKITSLGTPTVGTDASTKQYVDDKITALVGTAPSTLDTLQEIAAAINSDPNLYATLNNSKLNRDGTQAMTGALNMGTNKITNLVDPTNAQEATTKNYVDTAMSSQVAQAAASASAASTSATSASTSATNAASSATSAASSASTATTQAGNASASASAAATSATNAASSATSASASASTATTQAGNAATSASNAATYASNASASASSAATSATNANSSFLSVDTKYLGAKATAPTLNNQGGALTAGTLYWNTTTNAMYSWTGSAWGTISSTADIFRYKFNLSGGETSVSGVDANGLTFSYLVGKEQVYLNGVLLVRGVDYTATTGSSLTGIAAMAAGDILEIITFTPYDVATAINQSVITGKGAIVVGSAAGTPGALAVGTNGYYLQADSTQALGVKWAPVTTYTAPTIGSTSIASGATVTTINGLTKIQSNAHTQLDGNGYEMDLTLMNIIGAW